MMTFTNEGVYEVKRDVNGLAKGAVKAGLNAHDRYVVVSDALVQSDGVVTVESFDTGVVLTVPVAMLQEVQ